MARTTFTVPSLVSQVRRSWLVSGYFDFIFNSSPIMVSEICTVSRYMLLVQMYLCKRNWTCEIQIHLSFPLPLGPWVSLGNGEENLFLPLLMIAARTDADCRFVIGFIFSRHSSKLNYVRVVDR